MNDVVEPNVGSRVRALREERKLSLRALAQRSGLSVNAISLIERGENSPTVSSLHMLAAALQTSITDFFRSEAEQHAVFVSSSDRLTYRKGPMTMESLGIGLKNQRIEPFIVTLGIGGSGDDPVTHPGQEFVYCLEGIADYTVDDETYRLREGDSLLLEATRPHTFRNAGTETVRLLLVFQSTTNITAAGRTHMALHPGAITTETSEQD